MNRGRVLPGGDCPGTVADIRPREADMVLVSLIDSDDEEIAEAAYEAVYMAEGLSESDDLDENEDDESIH